MEEGPYHLTYDKFEFNFANLIDSEFPSPHNPLTNSASSTRARAREPNPPARRPMASNRTTSPEPPTDNPPQDLHPPTSPTAYEETHVHSIYTSIAPHFSLTRHTPWPLVSTFLSTRAPGSIGLDLGCGNGKNLPPSSTPPHIFILASDRSLPLVTIASTGHEPHTALLADVLRPPHPRGRFDFAICIAVLHHLSSAERRVEGVRGMLECLREGAEGLIFVWALEQRGSRRGWAAGGEQDVLVPWVMRGEKAGGRKGEGEERTFQRYYHLSVEGELEGWVREAGGVVMRGGWERDNWWVVARRRGKGEEVGKG